MSKPIFLCAVKYTVFHLRIRVYRLRLNFQRFTDHLLAPRRRKKLLYTNFSVICDNCLGGIGIYNKFGLPYSSPTVGLYFYPGDYIYFLENFKELISQPLKFKSISKDGSRKPYPLGVLGNDVEIRLSLIHISEPTRLGMISYAVFCLKKKKK